MGYEHKGRADNHPCSSLSDLIDQRSEKRGEEDGEERYHGKKDRSYIQIHTEERKKYGHAELLETDHTAVECHTEDCDHQETRIAQDLPYIRETELVLFSSLDLVGLSGLTVKLRIHGHKDSPQDCTRSKDRKSDQCRTIGFRQGVHFSQSLLLHDHRSNEYCRSSTETGNGKLKSHGQRHIPSFEPFRDRTGHRNTGDLASEAEEHAACVCNRKRGFRLESCRNGKGDETSTKNHHSYEDGTYQTYSEPVQKGAADDESAPYAQK